MNQNIPIYVWDGVRLFATRFRSDVAFQGTRTLNLWHPSIFMSSLDSVVPYIPPEAEPSPSPIDFNAPPTRDSEFYIDDQTAIFLVSECGPGAAWRSTLNWWWCCGIGRASTLQGSSVLFSKRVGGLRRHVHLSTWEAGESGRAIGWPTDTPPTDHCVRV